MLELTQPTLGGTTRHAPIGVGFTDARVCGCEWWWKPTIVRLGVDVPLRLGLMAIGAMEMDGHGGVSVAVSTVGLALHLRRVVDLGRAVWTIPTA